MADFNFSDPGNSFSGVLAANAVFTGGFLDVTSWTGVTVTLRGDANILRAAIEWSTDGVNVLTSDVFLLNLSPASLEDSVTTHSTVKAVFYRVVVENGSTAQGSDFEILAIVRNGSYNAYVSPNELPPNLNDESLSTKATIYGRVFGTGPKYAALRTSSTGLLHVIPEPGSIGVGGPTRIVARLTPVSLTLGPVTNALRDELTIFNDTGRGNLFIKADFSTVTTKNYHFKVPPQHTFKLPYSWRAYIGNIFGVWDEADGVALVRELT